MATYGLPKNKEMLVALGEIALRHGQLDNAMKMVFKDLTGVEEQEALDATDKLTSGPLMQRIRKMAKIRLGDGQALVKLEAILQRAERATKQRNEFFHTTWGIEAIPGTDSPRVVKRDARHTFQKAPTLKELRSTVNELECILEDILCARNEGFLSNALKKNSVKG